MQSCLKPPKSSEKVSRYATFEDYSRVANNDKRVPEDAEPAGQPDRISGMTDARIRSPEALGAPDAYCGSLIQG
jgi:hypothetical protein